MMTSDYISGRLDWNSRLVSKQTVRVAKGKGVKKPAGDDMSGLKPMTRDQRKDLDSLMASMEAKDVIPERAEGEGLKRKPKSSKLKDDVYDKISAIQDKYGLKKRKRTTKK